MTDIEKQVNALKKELQNLKSELKELKTKLEEKGVVTFLDDVYVGIRNMSDGPVGLIHFLLQPKETKVITYRQYLDIKDSVPFQRGVVIRDDSVVEDKPIGPADEVKNPNAFTPSELKAFVRYPNKDRLSKIDSLFVLQKLYHLAKQRKKKSLIKLIEERYDELFTAT